MIQLPVRHRILVVDDEPDVYAITKLNLRSLQYNGHTVKLEHVLSGSDAVAHMAAHPDTSVILLDVVMESDDAGLVACQQIRDELGNRLVRILLRTGQPGVAPEKKVIDEYDIDGYLPKSEMTTTRLYAAVRTAIKAYEQLVELERHRELLKLVHNCTIQVHAFDSLELALEKVLAAAMELTESNLVVLQMSARSQDGENETLLSLSNDTEDSNDANSMSAFVESARPDLSESRPVAFNKGQLVPITLHRDLGHGWLYVEVEQIDHLVAQVLPMLAVQAANVLYSVVARQLLEDREGPFYETLGV